jgi:hypothetical protein
MRHFHPAQVHPLEAAAAEESPAAPTVESSPPTDQNALTAAPAVVIDPAAAHPRPAHVNVQTPAPRADEQLTDACTGAPAAAGHQTAEQLGGPPALHRGGMGGTGSEWIACDECGKWRQAAVGNVARGPWTCSVNQDPRYHCRRLCPKHHMECRLHAEQGGQRDRTCMQHVSLNEHATNMAAFSAGSTHARCHRR